MVEMHATKYKKKEGKSKSWWREDKKDQNKIRGKQRNKYGKMWGWLLAMYVNHNIWMWYKMNNGTLIQTIERDFSIRVFARRQKIAMGMRIRWE